MMGAALTPRDRPCRSNLHDEPVAAVVVGTFDGSPINDDPVEPDSAYCLRCAVMLHDVGYFTPDDPTVQIPTIDEFLARRDRGEINQNGAPQ